MSFMRKVLFAILLEQSLDILIQNAHISRFTVARNTPNKKNYNLVFKTINNRVNNRVLKI